jgi:hypothetical protein
VGFGAGLAVVAKKLIKLIKKLAGNLKRTNHFRRLGGIWKDNIRMDIK